MRILVSLFILLLLPRPVSAELFAENIFIVTGAEKPEEMDGVNILGFDGNSWDIKKTSTILMRTAAGNTPDVVETMIERGADIHLKDPKGWTALFYAAAWNKDPGVINVFIKKGADINQKDNSGMTALMAAVIANTPGVVKALLNGGAEAEYEALGTTPLMQAVLF